MVLRSLHWLLLCTAVATVAAAADLEPVVKSWLAAQSQVKTWSADFIQTRTLKSLTQPLVSTGHVWYASPGHFRWELGNPAQTIAVRSGSELTILYPKLKRAERFSLSAGQSGAWRDALALLEAGFPRSQSELEVQYAVVAQNVKNGACEVALEPRSASARRMIPQIRITFDTGSFGLLGTQLQFADSSTMRNEFTNATLNPALPPGVFQVEIPQGFKVAQPLP